MLSTLLSSFLPTSYADEEEKPPKEEGGEGEEAKEEEEEEEEPEDPAPALREECESSGACEGFKKHFDHCNEKVTAGEGFKHEDCVEELCKFDLHLNLTYDLQELIIILISFSGSIVPPSPPHALCRQLHRTKSFQQAPLDLPPSNHHLCIAARIIWGYCEPPDARERKVMEFISGVMQQLKMDEKYPTDANDTQSNNHTFIRHTRRTVRPRKLGQEVGRKTRGSNCRGPSFSSQDFSPSLNPNIQDRLPTRTVTIFISPPPITSHFPLRRALFLTSLQKKTKTLTKTPARNYFVQDRKENEEVYTGSGAVSSTAKLVVSSEERFSLKSGPRDDNSFEYSGEHRAEAVDKPVYK